MLGQSTNRIAATVWGLVISLVLSTWLGNFLSAELRSRADHAGVSDFHLAWGENLDGVLKASQRKDAGWGGWGKADKYSPYSVINMKTHTHARQPTGP